ncbi:hypothetical protein ASPTUDRAFT_59120 [Aspergillus tubingensis CBS 134.48]|uniref:Uncharacterized protein n=1 Tax=Aspergillus tubingensis (strain CBS 134.48) TaxID=767770 RepID=A0A1L9MTT3_ASPTC|nr:hypothetical protein ASPTUDRAFT_59120 [Aspergillus tubingensis CBS 134.48]
MKTHLPRLNELRKVLASAERKPHSGIWSTASHITESAPPDDRKSKSQTASGEGMQIHEKDQSERDGLPDHPIDVASQRTLMSLLCENLEENGRAQETGNHHLHKRVSGIFERVPTPHRRTRRSAPYMEMDLSGRK